MNWDYLAGFLDGEGSIIIVPPRIRLYISNTNLEILEEIKNFVKCGNIYSPIRKNKKWAKQYGFAIGNHKDVLKILKNLQDKLFIKRKLCDNAIKYIENKRWHKTYLSEEELKKYIYLKSSRKIAKKLGVSQFSVLKYLKKYNLNKTKYKKDEI
jgi:hypothetical protein